MAFAQDLLEQAEHLARREPRKPRQASLRRAVSTAYAIFHLLVEEAAAGWRRPAERPALARIFNHGPMKAACLNLISELNKSPSALDEANAHLRYIARTFVYAQRARHEADYDGSRKWTRTQVIEGIETVAEAFARWKRIRQTEEAQRFLFTLLVKGR